MAIAEYAKQEILIELISLVIQHGPSDSIIICFLFGVFMNP